MRARDEPSEQRRVRFAVLLRSLQKLRQYGVPSTRYFRKLPQVVSPVGLILPESPKTSAPNATLLLAKAVLRDGFHYGALGWGFKTFCVSRRYEHTI
ncbi:hypothetical protein NCCP2331_11510 [Sporosarcina sp. NCCP-2331]|nr:hypothetical protein NCCP2331_11510 [Sporosarcina sp. NCCP-2331]GLB56633.1 hypothetical protein NCCP2378_24200 [Sporosarcina sp. NCCP-2378]